MEETRQSNDTLRIALFTYSTKPRGGVIHTLSLAEALQALGHHVHIFALGKDQDGFFRPTPVPCSLIPFEALPKTMGMDEKIRRYIQSYYDYMVAYNGAPFDIYHVQDCVSANAVWRLREDGRIEAFVRTIHHVDDFTSPSLIECQNNSIYRPDHRIVVSRDWQRRLRDDFQLEAEVIYNGVDRRFQPPSPDQRAAARAELELGDQLAVLNIGGVEPRKNSIRLLQAFEQVQGALAAEGRRAVLLLAGGEALLDHEPYRTAFAAELERSTLRLDRDIRLLGVVADRQMQLLYHAADVFAFPSVKEGWGLVAIEALASGLPLLTSDLPVFHEYARAEENALLVDPFDTTAIAAALLRLATDPRLRQRLAASGPHTAQQFSWQAAAQTHVDWYRRWLAEHKAEISE
jgi:glycosyltransferase-like protein